MATVADINTWVKKGDPAKQYQRVIALEIAMNPRGVYDFMKANKLLGASWTNGYERSESSRLKMSQLLNEAAVRSGNPMQFAKLFAASTPDADLTRDMEAAQAVRKLLSSNI